MKCARTRALLGEHLEGDLALPVRTRVDEHLRRCDDCKLELDQLRATVSLLRSMPSPEPPSTLVADVMNRIDSGQTRVARLPIGFSRVFDPRVAAPLAAGIAGVMVFATMNLDTGIETANDIANRDSGHAISGTQIAHEAANTQVRAAGASDPHLKDSSRPNPSAAASRATRRIADGIDRRIWEFKPVTLPGRAGAANQASASRPARFRVQPRLASMEPNLAIRLRRSGQTPSVGFYGRTDPDPEYLDLDAHIDRAKIRPEAFLAAVSSTAEADRGTFIAPFAARAARRGDGKVVAGRLRRESHPQARIAADQFEQSWHRTRTAQPTFSR